MFVGGNHNVIVEKHSLIIDTRVDFDEIGLLIYKFKRIN
jgi:hypothetical protein